MFTALDADPEELHPDARAFVETIRQAGWIATHAQASEASPAFTYTTGLWAMRGLPEMIVFGLGMDQAHGLFAAIVKAAEQGSRLKTGAPLEGLPGGVRAVLFATDRCKHDPFMLLTTWFYNHPGFPCVQVVLPDAKGALPWEEVCDPAFLAAQPDLTVSGWTASLAEAPAS